MSVPGRRFWKLVINFAYLTVDNFYYDIIINNMQENFKTNTLVTDYYLNY